MRDGESRLVDLLVPEQEKVEIERARAMLAGDADAAEALLGCEEPVEELPRGERRLDLGGAVEEERLRADADGLGLAERRDGHDLDPVLVVQGRERGTYRRLPVA